MNQKFDPSVVSEPIPIPLRERWRWFRINYLPVLTFGVLVVAAGWLWKHYIVPPTIIGEVQPTRAPIVSAVDGTITELKVELLEPVTNGQPLVVVSALEPAQLEAELQAIEADLRLMQARMDLDKARNLDAYSQLHFDLLTEELNLELAKVRLVQAEAEFERAKALLESGFIARGQGMARNDFGYDVALRDRDALRAEVTAREKTVTVLRSALAQLEAAGAARVEPRDDAIERAIAAQRERLRRLQGPVVLTSPINGFVSAIHLFAGQKVTAGTPILMVSAERSRRVVAWVRQPVTRRPSVGDTVEVRRLAPGQPIYEGTVVKVGAQLEQISAGAYPFSASTPQRIEFGLPLIVEVSESAELIPGEAVQVRLAKSGRTADN
ncbi:MAG: HlyD family efflux transporter periplasmic adaptor subunit [Verrucomicrobiae bacterium]|nr:HlyD family efflux transporter periplasmic adaptor subunit [Verrucomicrobiae bacterium]MDW7979915.1 HlyD family efflux transporter periplasmic adaptor subunit [Verrucomicrobiales bacterium]